jgi:hypothetical protein
MDMIISGAIGRTFQAGTEQAVLSLPQSACVREGL